MASQRQVVDHDARACIFEHSVSKLIMAKKPCAPEIGDGLDASGQLRGGRSVPPAAERVTFQVHRVNAKLAQVANAVFRAHDVDLISSRILVFLLERPEIRVGDIVELMVLPQSTISHQLQRLEKRGFIRRRRVKEDNRAVSVALTARGKAVATACNTLSLDIYAHLLGGLETREVSDLRRLLGKMFRTLDAYAASPDGG